MHCVAGAVLAWLFVAFLSTGCGGAGDAAGTGGTGAAAGAGAGLDAHVAGGAGTTAASGGTTAGASGTGGAAGSDASTPTGGGGAVESTADSGGVGGTGARAAGLGERGTPAEQCPGVGAAPVAGENGGFEAAGQTRTFHLWLPDFAAHAGDRPLFMALTGTEQTEVAFTTAAELDGLTERGFVVVAPVRNRNGMLWWPWDDERKPESVALPNPDLAFFEQLVRCLNASFDVDDDRIYVGGISAGGTMTSKTLRALPRIFAGGVAFSGVWSVNGSTLEPAESPPIEDVLYIAATGGPEDRYCYSGSYPGCAGEIVYIDHARLSSTWFAAQGASVVHCAAGGDSNLPSGGPGSGHYWHPFATNYLIDLLLAHPKGGKTFKLGVVPDLGKEWSCGDGRAP